MTMRMSALTRHIFSCSWMLESISADLCLMQTGHADFGYSFDCLKRLLSLSDMSMGDLSK